MNLINGKEQHVVMKIKVLISSIFISILLLLCIVIGIQIFKNSSNIPSIHKIEKAPKKYDENEFNLNLIKTVNSTNSNNYLISPYSIEIALNMLKEGANGYTKEELTKVIKDRKITDLSAKDRISIANAIFIKNEYNTSIKKEYKNILTDKYKSEVIYDDFKTPNIINDWVNDKTNHMINKVIDEISPDFVLGLANAIAIDVEWNQSFECNRTTSSKFTKKNKENIDVEMMHNSYEGKKKYIENEKGKGVIIPYQKYKDKELEFIAFLPNKDVNNYIENLTEDDLEYNDSLEVSSDKLIINVALPRFTYEYDLDNFINVLKTMGIKEAFDEKKADFTNMFTPSDNLRNLYVAKAIHKTKIELNEKGTKAAAVTYIELDKETAAIIEEEPKIINIEFNKPFVYLIRDSKTKEILFFGVTYEPNIWKGTTCSKR